MMRECVVVILAGIVLFGCKVNNPRYCDEATQCGDPERPFCDLAGIHPASGGVAHNCIACEPNAFLGCLGDTATSCNADGSEQLSEECPFGCNASLARCNQCDPGMSVCVGEALTVCGADGGIEATETCPLGCHPGGERCYELEPSNDLRFYLDQSAEAADLVLTDGATIDTDSGDVIDGDGMAISVDSVALPVPENGVAVRVFVVGSLTAGDVVVSGEPAIAIVAYREIVLTGEFSVSATAQRDGPGAIAPKIFVMNDPCIGKSSGQANGNQGGYGGGGNATPGADGGAVIGEFVGGVGGIAVDNDDLDPLRGGCSGGAYSASFVNGGGAVQFVSRMSFALAPNGYVSANGAGGHLGDVDFRRAGGGGGSGGGILIEAQSVDLSPGTGLVANGGAGGCGRFGGQDGQISNSPANGAPCNELRYRRGGDGGIANTFPEIGAALQYSSVEQGIAGSGGGAAGFIRINTRSGSYGVTVGDVILSPVPTTGLLQAR